MITPVNKLHFETQKDIIDYVSRGMCPSKESFDALMVQVRNPATEPRDPNTKGPYVEPTVVPEPDREVLASIMERVYENRKWNRNVMIASAVGVIALALVFHGCASSSDSKTKDKDDDLVLYRLDNGEFVELDRVD